MMGEIDAKKKNLDVYDYIFNLEQKIKFLEGEKQALKTQSVKLHKENQQLKAPPYIVGVIEDIVDDKVIIKNSNGLEFLVKGDEENINQLYVGARVAMTQQSLKIAEILSEPKDRQVKAMEIIEKPQISFEDIGGLKNERLELEEAVILPMIEPKKFKELGIESPKGVLLYGQPGTGKTMLAKAVANKTNSTFISITAPELVRKFIGEGARLVRDVFKLASEKEHAIIFIDEIDAIGGTRNNTTTGDREVQRTLMQLLSEIDGFKNLDRVKIIAATNRIDILDPALLRAGRFDRLIEVSLPDAKEREQIFKIHTRKMKLSKKVDFSKFAEITNGVSGADIKSICMEAGIFALRETKKNIGNEEFLKAISKLKRENKNQTDHEKMWS